MMKRVLFILAVVATTITKAEAQTGRPILAPKSAFAAQIKSFDSLVALGKKPDAKLLLNKMDFTMHEQMRYCKYKIGDAQQAHDAPGVKAGQKNLRDKWDIINDISRYTDDPITNKSAIDTRLNNFMTIMD